MLDRFLTTPEKIYYKTYIRCHGIRGCFYNNNKMDTSRRFILYLDYPKFIHLGDTLWCEPVARLLAENFNMTVCCNSSMQFYFRQLGYRVIDGASVKQDDLLVARTELAYHLRHRDVFWINFNYINVSEPLINAVLNNIARYLNIEVHNAKPRAVDFTPERKNSAIEKFSLDVHCKYAVVNNYIDSHHLGMRQSHLRRAGDALRRFAEKFKEETGLKLIHTGTEKEKKQDPADEKIFDLDLRGMTSVEDSFVLASLDNVVHYIGFDAFWLHLFNIHDKKSYVMLRPGFSARWRNQVKNYVATPYRNPESRVVFIEEQSDPALPEAG